MQVFDIISRVQFLCDDIDGTYVTVEYVSAGMQHAYDWLFNKMALVDSQFDQYVVELPGVQAGVPDLSAYQADGQPLALLLQPRMIRWKLPGQDKTYYRRADGPLTLPRDMPDSGYPMIDSWAWSRHNILLSKFSTALDIEITGDFLFDPLTAPDSQILLAKNLNRCFACKLASEVGKARGNDKWVTLYSADADEAYDDVAIAMVKARQAIPNRVARMSRNQGNATQINLGR